MLENVESETLGERLYDENSKALVDTLAETLPKM